MDLEIRLLKHKKNIIRDDSYDYFRIHRDGHMTDEQYNIEIEISTLKEIKLVQIFLN